MREISVIIPCHNMASYIDRCMMSVTTQTTGLDRLEIICVDAASTDDTWTHLQRWEQRFPDHVILVRQEINRGQGTARNIGLQYASASWVAFVDAGDWLEPDYFEQLYGQVKSCECDVVACGCTDNDSAGREDGYFEADTREKKKEMLYRRFLGNGAGAKIIRKNLLIDCQIFFPEDMAYGDMYWAPLLHVYAENVYIINRKLYHYFAGDRTMICSEDQSCHIDWITVQLMKWWDYEKRGLWLQYREELGYDSLLDAVHFMKMLVLRRDQPSFSLFQLEKELIRQHVPDYRNNQYTNVFTGISALFMKALYLSMNKADFHEFTAGAKKYYDENDDCEIWKTDMRQGRGSRIVMFYSGTESFNFFTDHITGELQKRGHEVFICNLDDTASETVHSYRNLNRFLSRKVDMVICFDGIGTREEQFIRQWNRHQAVVVDILMDPPFRFHPTLERHPEKYLLFCCDLEHVEYVKKYFHDEVPKVAFMPHVGTLMDDDTCMIPYEERKYDILFSGSYFSPQSQLEKIKELFPEEPDKWRFYQQMYDNLTRNSDMTIEEAVLNTLRQFNLSVSDTVLKMLLNCSLYVDWAIRMYHRGRVVMSLAEAGFELYLLGPGWENHSSVRYPNVHHIDGQVPYKQTLSHMADAKINLNVMPWFKAGTHDRIFNTLLQHSLPLTDSSIWISENFTDGEDIALYHLDHLDLLPGKVQHLLEHPSEVEAMIRRGYEKVSRNFTWSDYADWILEAAGIQNSE